MTDKEVIYQGQKATIVDEESHRGEQMLKIQTGDDEGWVFGGEVSRPVDEVAPQQ